ncbi:MAG: potassium transporter TrkG [Bacteroidales bacterium]
MTPLLSHWRELIRLRIYDNRHGILNTLRVIGLFVAATSLGAIIYYYGFQKTPQSSHLTKTIVLASLTFYFFKFTVKFLLSLDIREFFKQNWFESMMMGGLLLIWILRMVFGFSPGHLAEFIGIRYLPSYTILFIQIYFLIIFALELGKGSRFLAELSIGPNQMLTISFLLLIFGGTGLLLLPEMTTAHHIRFIDALFTSTSASCVTGLAVVDTGTYFTLKGQLVILLLIQLGGLNIISFATFFATFYRQNAGVKYQSLMKDMLSVEGLSDTRHILRKIFYFSILIETIGTVFIYFLWGSEVSFASSGQRWYYSIFHAVSAFNNAGFSPYTNGLYELPVRYSYFLHLAVATLIFLGGIGFLAMQDMFSIKNIRDRWTNPWKKLTVNTRIVLYTSLLLILTGSLLFFILERNNSLKDLSFFGTVTTCIFQSVTPRTAGFNTVDFTQLFTPTIIVLMFLMFVGASPGSTGGGIKTTTFAVMAKSAIATITGRKNLEFFKQSIKEEVVGRAYAIVLFSISLIGISSFFLSISDPTFQFEKILFEEISAFGTVGLSTGITPLLSDMGKTILVLSMFIGRIGTLTLALTISRKALYTKYKYASANLLIG